MGYEIVAVDPDGQRIGAVRVGTNGSQDVMFGLWLAAYAAGQFADSDRVRDGWLRPVGPARSVRGARGGHRLTIDTVRSLIAMNTGQGHDVQGGFVTPRPAAITTSLSSRPTACPILAPIIEFWAASYGVTLGNELVARLAPAASVLNRSLVESCWHDRLGEVANLLAEARRRRATCRVG